MTRRARRTAFGMSVNLTPMIDVVFQLIIFFVVTANLTQESVMKHIVLPTADHAQRDTTVATTVQVDADGRYYVGRTRYSLSELRTLLGRIARVRGPRNVSVVIRGDANAAHRGVKDVMNACSAQDIRQIRIATRKD